MASVNQFHQKLNNLHEINLTKNFRYLVLQDFGTIKFNQLRLNFSVKLNILLKYEKFFS